MPVGEVKADVFGDVFTDVAFVHKCVSVAVVDLPLAQSAAQQISPLTDELTKDLSDFGSKGLVRGLVRVGS